MRLNKYDTLNIFSLIICAVILILPVINGRVLTYLDNPVHLAEISDMATYGFGSWSELSFCGMPLSTLHSPLWYGLLALLGYFGIPLTFLYSLMLIAGTVAPSIAIYITGRRYSDSRLPLLLAWLYLIIPTNTGGISSAIGGMWTFHIGCAMFIILADQLNREKDKPLSHAITIALIGLTHHFVLSLSVILVIVSMSVKLIRKKTDFRKLLFMFLCYLFSVMASAIYWAPVLLYTDLKSVAQQNLSPLALLIRTFTSSDLFMLLTSQPLKAVNTELFFTDSLPPIALFITTVILIVKKDRINPALFPVSLTILILLPLVLLILPVFPMTFFGPVPWRLVSFIHISMVLASIALLKKREAASDKYRLKTILPVVIILSAFLLNLPLQNSSNPDEQRDLKDLQTTWQWLKTNSENIRGRVYLESTFTGTARQSLGYGHTMALTRIWSGAPQTGTYYGIHPYRTGSWLHSDFGMFFGMGNINPNVLKQRMTLSNTGMIITSSDQFHEVIRQLNRFSEVYKRGRFSIWYSKSFREQWCFPLVNGIRELKSEYSENRLTINTVNSNPSARLLASLSHHPWWKHEQNSKIQLRKHSSGLLVIDNIPEGSHEIEIHWSPPIWPLILTLLGWIGLLSGTVPEKMKTL